MLTIVCFKWERLLGDGSLARPIPKYTATHVNALHNMVWRNIRIPHRFVCITDDSSGIDPRIEVIPLWDKCRNLGGCFNRLYVFSEDMKTLIGERFICIDLDVVILKDITSLVTREDDFIINSYNPYPAKVYRDEQLYNGGLFMMSAGSRKQVWEKFDTKTSPQEIKNSKNVIGTDQAWIRLVLGDKEARFTQSDGIFEARVCGANPPHNARIILFAGHHDPSVTNKYWVVDNWR